MDMSIDPKTWWFSWAGNAYCGIKTTWPDNKTEQRTELNLTRLLFYSLSFHFQSKYSRSLCTDCYFHHKIAPNHAVRAFITKNTPKLPKRTASSCPLFISHFDVYLAILESHRWPYMARMSCNIQRCVCVGLSVLVPGRWWPAGDPAARNLTSLWTLGAKLAKFTVHQITRYAAWAAVIIHTAIYSALSITEIKSRASLKPLTVMFELGQEINSLSLVCEREF